MNSMKKYCLDANTLIQAWNFVYPPEMFPILWEWLSKDKNKKHCIFIQPIYNEIDPYASTDKKLPKSERQKKYPLRIFLEDNFISTTVDNDSQETALQLRKRYETKNTGKGAHTNDILLIAFAKNSNHIVVTMEAKQPQPPQNLFKYKIPLICQRENVDCIDFITFLRKLDFTER